MELNTQEQSQKINGMLQRVSQSVDTVYNIAIADLEDPEEFKSNKEYVDT